ncbi:uncharacterized protein MAM_08229 [Metarhizium album ARSEF 1941]|uniref:Muramidase n=1 Tax=Metarhizium album (strain ARSEF 1941) TaxID=1081103 RepID=A0A0B2WKC0_METAS|nr:uncharacterized protein MAM_08229 [Metarhizium album ARSEF 1941]KHN93922.1 hypothetical protein MAM_08229 [Metarhizium album ARSEF 1941]
MFSHIPVFAVALAALSAALPTQTLDRRAVADRYVFYQGSGANWPSQGAWGSFDSLWNTNLPLMQKSCGWNGWGADNSGAEINSIKNAINQVSQATGVDRSFILSIIMQESKGCVRVPTTNNGVRNPGLMQSHNGSGSCAGVTPCSGSAIAQMVRDGVAGTSFGDGLRQSLAKAKRAIGNNSRAYYAAARMYNSGSVDYNNLDNGLGSTPCYATDVANRLTGWTLAASQCRA